VRKGKKCIFKCLTLAIRTSKGHRVIKMDRPVTVCEQRCLYLHAISFKAKNLYISRTDFKFILETFKFHERP